MLPSLIYGVGETDSSRYNYLWLKQFDAEMISGQIYPRWLVKSFIGFGSPAFIFYPPLAFAVTSFINIITFNHLQIPVLIAISTTMMLSVSGLAMIAWLREYTTVGPALILAIAYVGSPYHLADHYWRGAFSELCFMSVLPFTMLSVRFSVRAWRGIASLALTYAFLLTAHLPSALLASVTIMPAYALYRSSNYETYSAKMGGASRYFLGCLLGFGIAAIYLAPALSLQSFISSAQLWRPSYTPVKWLLINPGQWPSTLFMLMIASFTLTALIGSVGCTLLSCSMKGGRRREIVFWGCLSFTCVFLVTLGPPALWNYVPFIGKVQFPWRLLSLIEFSIITACALLLGHVERYQAAILGYLMMFAISPGIAILYTHTATKISATHDYWASFIPHAATFMPDASEYLPAGFPEELIGKAAAPEIKTLPKANEVNCRPSIILCSGAWSDTRREMVLDLDSVGPAEVSVNKFYFPSWKATGDKGQVFNLTPSPRLRTLQFHFSGGRSIVHLVVGHTEIEIWGLMVTIISAIIAIMITLCHTFPGARRVSMDD